MSEWIAELDRRMVKKHKLFRATKKMKVVESQIKDILSKILMCQRLIIYKTFWVIYKKESEKVNKNKKEPYMFTRLFLLPLE